MNADMLDAVAPLAPNAWLRYELVARMLPDGAANVLEIGCGQGAFGVRLAQRYDYLGVEPDRQSWTAARARMEAAGRGQVRNVTVQDLDDGRFDLVCAFEVLEHIEDDVAALKEWAGRLNERGWLLLSVPANQRRFGPWDALVGHFRRYDPDAMVALLTSCGFTDVRVRLYGFPLGHLLETGRNAIARRRLAANSEATVAERTAGSGRQLQLSSGRLRGAVTRWGTLPFRKLQLAFPSTGTGLVVLARYGKLRRPDQVLPPGRA